MPNHIARLEAEGVVKTQVLNDQEKQLINGLTKEEVDTLISLHQRLGPVAKGRDDARPAFPV